MEYTFDISLTENNKVNIESLSIVVSDEFASFEGIRLTDVIIISFSEELTNEDLTVLNDIIVEHNGLPTEENINISAFIKHKGNGVEYFNKFVSEKYNSNITDDYLDIIEGLYDVLDRVHKGLWLAAYEKIDNVIENGALTSDIISQVDNDLDLYIKNNY